MGRGDMGTWSGVGWRNSAKSRVTTRGRWMSCCQRDRGSIHWWPCFVIRRRTKHSRSSSVREWLTWPMDRIEILTLAVS